MDILEIKMLKLNSANTYIIGCTHFSHTNIIRYASRPFKSVEEMNERLFDGIESLPNNSILIHLGDFSFGGNAVILRNWEQFYDILHSKNIFCHFLWGNHDKYIKKMYHGYDGKDNISFYDILEFSLEGLSDFIVASHYPMEDWHGRAAHHTNYETPTGGSYHIHCHTHRELESSKGIRRIHGGVDTIGFQPILIKDLLNKIG